MFVVYILLSESTGKFYVGHTADLQDRLIRHNQGRFKSTASGVPWTLFRTETFQTRSEAVRREREIKSWKSSKRIHDLNGEHPA